MGAVPDALIGRKAIAEELGISVDRVTRLARAGAPIFRLWAGRGSRYYASRAELRAWLTNKRELTRTTTN